MKTIVFLTIVAILPLPAISQWNPDPLTNNILSSGIGAQLHPAITSDGLGGAIAAWLDASAPFRAYVSVQRITADGVTLYQQGGLHVAHVDTSAEIWVTNLRIDRDRNIYLGYYFLDYSLYHRYYVQKLDSNGTVLWNPDGIYLTDSGMDQVRLYVDRDGRVVVCFNDYAQRFDDAGKPLWGSGVRLDSTGKTSLFDVVSGEHEMGTVVLIRNNRTLLPYQFYIQKVLSDGTLRWSPPGRAISPASATDVEATTWPIGGGGGILVWKTPGGAMLAQRFDTTGSVFWSEPATVLDSTYGWNICAGVIPDDSGGAIVAWMGPTRSPGRTDRDVFAQRINRYGAKVWDHAGVVVCNAIGDQRGIRTETDGNGGTILAWRDERNGGTGNNDIYAQRLDDSGVAQWQANGVPVCTAPGKQVELTMISDSAHGAILAWTDYRDNGRIPIYASRLTPLGTLLPVTLVSFAARRAETTVEITWRTADERGSAGFAIERGNAAGRWTEIGFVASDGGAGAHGHVFVDRTPPGERTYYRLRMTDLDGTVSYSDAAAVEGATSPAALVLFACAPNPFGSRTTVSYDMREEGESLVEVYDALGRRVAELDRGMRAAGYHTLSLDGAPLAAGMYTIRVRTAAGTACTTALRAK